MKHEDVVSILIIDYKSRFHESVVYLFHYKFINMAKYDFMKHEDILSILIIDNTSRFHE